MSVVWEVQTRPFRRRCAICNRGLHVGLFCKRMERFVCGDCARGLADAVALEVGPALDAAEKAVLARSGGVLS